MGKLKQLFTDDGLDTCAALLLIGFFGLTLLVFWVALIVLSLRIIFNWF